MRYFRYYPWFLQTFLFLLMVITLYSFSSALLIYFLPKVTPFTANQVLSVNENSPRYLLNVMIVVQGIFSAATFLGASLLFSYLSHPDPAKYLGLRRPGKPIHILLAIGIMLGAAPVLQAIEIPVSHINFGPALKAAQEKNEALTRSFLTIPDFTTFLRVFVVMAVTPAIGEELFFRGVLMRLVRQKSRNMFLPVIFTAGVFAFTHANVYGFLSIFIAGILLAVIYNLTGSIWCGIAGHLFFNGVQIIAAWVMHGDPDFTKNIENSTVSWPLVITGLVVFATCLYLMIRNKTPLPENWSDNFADERISGEVN